MRAIRILLGFTLVLAVAGFGRGDGRLSKSDFISKANGICKTYNAKIDKVAAPKGFDDVADYIDKTVKISREEVDKLAKLKPPKDIQKKVDAILDEVRKSNDLGKKVRDAAKKGDKKGVQDALADVAKHGEKGNELSKALGLDVCAK